GEALQRPPARHRDRRGGVRPRRRERQAHRPRAGGARRCRRVGHRGGRRRRRPRRQARGRALGGPGRPAAARGGARGRGRRPRPRQRRALRPARRAPRRAPRRGGRRDARRRRRRLAALRRAGGADRQDRRARALRGARHLGRGAAPLGHEPREGDRGREQGRRRAHLQGRRLRHRRRRRARRARAPGGGQGDARGVSPRRGFAVRRAERRDLAALVELEKGFPGDRMSRASLSRLLGRESAVVLVAESGGEVIGDAVVLFRSGFRSARLYSMIVSPEHRGRGVARALLAEAEAAARERGSVSLRLEVREDNRPAIALYESEGYEAVGAAPAYYEDGGGAIRMVKRFLPGSSTLLGVPFYGQTLDFTCGPACLMMAMRHHGYPVPLERWLGLTLGREAATVFVTSGHGGCSAHGLAVAALRRGFQATVVTRDAGVPFLDSVRSEAKKEVIALAHETFEREIKALGGRV